MGSNATEPHVVQVHNAPGIMVRIAVAAVVAVLAVTVVPAAVVVSRAVVVEVLEEAVAGAKGQRGDSEAQATSLMRGRRRLDMGRCHAPSVTLRDCGPALSLFKMVD